MEIERIAKMYHELRRPVKGWYKRTYPNDDLGRELPMKTFADYLEAVTKPGENVYALMGAADDSIIRERIFDKLAEIIGVDYSEVYHAWLNGDED